MTSPETNILEHLRRKIDEGEHDDAISALLDILRSKADIPDIYRLLAYAYLKAGNTTEALQQLKAARSVGTTAQIELAFGRMLRTHQFFAAALTCFQAALKLEPENIDALALATMTYHSLSEVTLMIESGQRCLEIADTIARQQPVDPLPFSSPMKFDPGSPRRNIIAFSLFGKNPYYYESAMASASIALAIYPEWKCRFYCAPEVPPSCLDTLRRLKSQIALMSNTSQNWSGLFWRFFAFDDPNIDFVMVRDVDSPFTLRERLAVEDWLTSEFPFHVIRDHPNHLEPMMAGLWAGCTGLLPPIEPMIRRFLPTIKTRYADQHFLRLHIWPRICNITLAHDRYYSLRNSRRPPEHPTQDKVSIGFGLPR